MSSEMNPRIKKLADLAKCEINLVHRAPFTCGNVQIASTWKDEAESHAAAKQTIKDIAKAVYGEDTGTMPTGTGPVFMDLEISGAAAWLLAKRIEGTFSISGELVTGSIDIEGEEHPSFTITIQCLKEI